MTNEHDVIVIGGGLGGLTAAALIAQAGRRTLLIERNREIGGAAGPAPACQFASAIRPGRSTKEKALLKRPQWALVETLFL